MRRSYSGERSRTIGRIRWAARRLIPRIIRVPLAVGVLAGLAATGSVAAPADVLAELRQSLFPHGNDALRAIRTTARVEVAGDSAGSVETVATLLPAALRETLELSGVRQVATLVGEGAWFEDANGKVRRAAGDELATYRLGHALLFHTDLDRPPEGFTLDASPAALVFTPRGEGAPRTLELARNAEDLLLPTLIRQRQQGTDMVITFEDWRQVGPLRFPYRSTQTTGDPRFDLTLVTTSVEFPDALRPGEIAAPDSAARTRDAAVVDRALAAEIPLRRVGALATVEVTIHGTERADFLLDTGAGATVLSNRLTERLGLPVSGVVEARGAGGSEAASFVHLSSLSLPGVELRDQTLVSLPLEDLRTVFGRSLDGILGYDFFSRFVVRIDYAKDRLSLFAAGTYSPPRDEAHRLPLHLSANVPRVEGVLDDEHRGSFVIDLGNASPLVLHRAFAERVGYLARAAPETFPLAGIGGTELMRSVPVKRLALGDLVFEEIDAVVPVSRDGALSLDDSAGNVGAGMFAGRVLVLDYDAESLWVLRSTARSASIR